MRHGIVEGEPGSMPWGQWWLRRVIRDRVRGNAQDRRPEAEPGRSGTEQAAGEDENAGGGTPTS